MNVISFLLRFRHYLYISDHLEFPLSCLYSLLLPVTLTSSAPRRTCHSCWSPSPTSSWHKVLTKIKIFVHTLLVMLSSVHTVELCLKCHDVPSLSDDSPPLIAQNEIKRTFYFTGDLRVTGSRVTSILHPHTVTCQVYEVYPICTVN